MKFLFLTGFILSCLNLFPQSLPNTINEINELECDSWLYLPDRGSFFEFGELDVPGNKITVEAMINRTTPYTGGNLYAGDVVSKHREPTNTNYLLRPNSAEITAGGRYRIAQAQCEIELNKTYHIALVYDGSTLKYYRNGHLMSSVSAQGDLYQNSFKSRVGIYEANIHNEQFIGYVNEVRVWNVARTQQELRDNMNKRLPNPESQPGLLAYFNFSSLKNLQGNSQYDGRISGNASIGRTNPTCKSFTADGCFQNPDGYLKGSVFCSDQIPMLSFSRISGKEPFVLTYTDGTNIYTQSEVFHDIPFPVKELPLNPITKYKLISVTDANGQTTAVSTTDSEAEIKLENCSSCIGISMETLPKYDFGTGSGNPTMAEYNDNLASDYEHFTGNATGAGKYSISNRIPSSPNNHTGTGGFTGDGRMAIFHLKNIPSELMRIEIDNNCNNYNYSFSFAVANAVKSTLASSPPELSVYIENTDGEIISYKKIGEILPTDFDVQWTIYEINIPQQYNSSKFIVRIINDDVKPGNQNNIVLIDEIELKVCMPELQASFEEINFKDSLSVCPKDELNLYTWPSGASVEAINWQFKSGNGNWESLNSSDKNVKHILNEATGFKYFRYIIDTGGIDCILSSNILVATINNNPIVEFSDDSICEGGDAFINFTVKSGLYPIKLNFNIEENNFSLDINNQSGNFRIDKQYLSSSIDINNIEFADYNGCIGSASQPVSIFVTDIPQGGIEGDDACEGENAQLFFSSTSSKPLNITITDGDQIWKLTNLNDGDKFELPIINNSNSAKFQVLELLDPLSSGCIRKENFQIPEANINILPKPKLEFAPIDPVCENEDPFFITTAYETSGLPGIWSYSGAKGLRVDGFINPEILSSGNHKVTFNFKAFNGCSDSIATNFIVNPIPDAFAGSDRIICQDTIHLMASGGSNFEWVSGNNLSDKYIANPVAHIYQNENFIVKVTDDAGCFAFDTIKIFKPFSSINGYNIPNAFTPNNDGKNDCFGVTHWQGVELKELAVFNRWGQKVFSTKDPSKCWDGYFNGRKQENGGYIYQITANTPCGELYRKGIVMLIN